MIIARLYAYPPGVLLSILIGCLVAALGAEFWLLSPAAADARENRADTLAALDAGDYRLADPLALTDYGVVLDKPLFSVSRSPVVDEAPVVEEQSLKSKWLLSAIISTGVSTFALFAEVEGTQRLRLEKGMELDGWTIEDLDARQVLLRRAGQAQTFVLGEDRAGEPAAKGIPAPAPRPVEPVAASKAEPGA